MWTWFEPEQHFPFYASQDWKEGVQESTASLGKKLGVHATAE